MSAERIAALEAIPGWTWSVFSARWDDGIIALRAFVEREGHANIHSKHFEPDGFKLGNWLGSRRYEYRQGVLSAERIAALEAIPGWTWDAVGSEQWEKGIEALRAFVEREGHTSIRHKHVEPDGFKLGHWACARRTEYRQGNLSDKRIEELESIPGWTWNALKGSRQ
ncbi:helicase associated domain-containing protein [Acidiphilium acidophilum]|uniref:Helicase associated domain-containing protein n=1 Tax=Acidiphilium acidophilum TaxID=76588 RepID=A0AAW9DKQ5_ACIAO|nr:helicase associated domain-containing protein [Acidiphilium acidophilum]MDX5929436.1 helicase associated domain-containing protein [Acidiphilium acidophilum]